MFIPKENLRFENSLNTIFASLEISMGKTINKAGNVLVEENQRSIFVFSIRVKKTLCFEVKRKQILAKLYDNITKRGDYVTRVSNKSENLKYIRVVLRKVILTAN